MKIGDVITYLEIKKMGMDTFNELRTEIREQHLELKRVGNGFEILGSYNSEEFTMFKNLLDIVEKQYNVKIHTYEPYNKSGIVISIICYQGKCWAADMYDILQVADDITEDCLEDIPIDVDTLRRLTDNVEKDTVSRLVASVSELESLDWI